MRWGWRAAVLALALQLALTRRLDTLIEHGEAR